jgi:hypothetical protein
MFLPTSHGEILNSNIPIRLVGQKTLCRVIRYLLIWPFEVEKSENSWRQVTARFRDPKSSGSGCRSLPSTTHLQLIVCFTMQGPSLI